jgi:hypothetical protein
MKNIDHFNSLITMTVVIMEHSILIYSKSGNCLFTHISRTAGTTISNRLYLEFTDCTQLLEQHSALVEAINVIADDFLQLYKFCVVRNPWERMVSWYSLIEKTTLRGNPEPKRLGDPDSKHWREFDSFLESWLRQTAIIDGRSRCKLSQWAQFVDASDEILVDKICRFESISTDFKQVCGHLQIPVDNNLRLNQSHFHHYSNYYSQAGRELVETLCFDDIQHLGYCYNVNKK